MTDVTPVPTNPANPPPVVPYVPPVAPIVEPVPVLPPTVQGTSTTLTYTGAAPVLTPTNPWKSRLHILNLVIGALLAASGAVTAYADTLGSSRWVSVVFGGIGVLQTLVVGITVALSS